MARGKPQPQEPGAQQAEPVRRPGESRLPGPLPAGLDLLWGLREHGHRGPRPGLSLDAIIEAAVRLADAEGLEAVSMARVAQALGFTTMSLYRHVASKDELLQLMWNASALDAGRAELGGNGWRERIRNWALVQREVIDRHPWITQMPMAAPPLGPNSLTFLERGLQTLDETGLSGQDKLRVIGLLSSYTLSEARMANDAARAAGQMAAEPAGAEAAVPRTFEALLRELIDEEHYPQLHKIAWSAYAEDGAVSPGEERREFLFGIELILDGVQALIDQTGRFRE